MSRVRNERARSAAHPGDDLTRECFLPGVLDVLEMRFSNHTVLPGETHPTLLYASGDYAHGLDPRACTEQVDALEKSFFALFTNRNRVVPGLPARSFVCVPGTRIAFAGASFSEAADVQIFIRPRAALSPDGSITANTNRNAPASEAPRLVSRAMFLLASLTARPTHARRRVAFATPHHEMRYELHLLLH